MLWSALFALAVIARDTSPRFVPHLLELASAGVLPALLEALAAYQATVEEQGAEPDEMVSWPGGREALHEACSAGSAGSPSWYLRILSHPHRLPLHATHPSPVQILRAGEFLAIVLAKARRLLWVRRTRRLTRVAIAGALALAAFRWLRHRAGHQARSGPRR